MLRRGGGHMVNVSSLAGVGEYPANVAYSASKAALSHFTAGLRADYRGLPMVTTLVELGPVPTGAGYGRRLRPDGQVVRTLLPDKGHRPMPRETVAQDIVRAVQKGKRHVRHAKRTGAWRC